MRDESERDTGDVNVEHSAGPSKQPATAAYVVNGRTAAPPTAAYPVGPAAHTNAERFTVAFGTELELAGQRLTVLGEVSAAAQSGEAQVFRARAGDHEVALKVYLPSVEREPSADVLATVASVQQANVLRLHSYGAGAQKLHGRYCYEICDLAAGGDLTQLIGSRPALTLPYLKDVLVPQVFNAMLALHARMVVHGDIKPHNLLFLDADRKHIVLGDFGASKMLNQGSRTGWNNTSVARGTAPYESIDQSRGMVSTRNDYFSLGMTLLHLMYPKQFPVDHRARNVLDDRIQNGQPPIEYADGWGRANRLISGLTLPPANRWGEKQVRAWLEGATPEVRFGAGGLAIKVGRVALRTADELAKYVEEDPKWHERLIQDRQGRDKLMSLLVDLLDIGRKVQFEKVIEGSRDPAIWAEGLLRLLDSERTITIGAIALPLRSVHLTDDLRLIAEELVRFREVAGIDRQRGVVFQVEFRLRQLAAEMPEVESRLRLMQSALGLRPTRGDDDWECQWQTMISGPAEERVRLLRTLSGRTSMRGPGNEKIATLEQAAQCFVRFPQALDTEEQRAELNVFVRSIGREDLVQATWRELAEAGLASSIVTAPRFIGLDTSGSQAELGFVNTRWLRFEAEGESVVRELQTTPLQRVLLASVDWHEAHRQLAEGEAQLDEALLAIFKEEFDDARLRSRGRIVAKVVKTIFVLAALVVLVGAYPTYAFLNRRMLMRTLEEGSAAAANGNWDRAFSRIQQVAADVPPDEAATWSATFDEHCGIIVQSRMRAWVAQADWASAIRSLGQELPAPCDRTSSAGTRDVLTSAIVSSESSVPDEAARYAIEALAAKTGRSRPEALWLDQATSRLGGFLPIESSPVAQSLSWTSENQDTYAYEITAQVTTLRWHPEGTLVFTIRYALAGKLKQAQAVCRPKLTIGSTRLNPLVDACAPTLVLTRGEPRDREFEFKAPFSALEQQPIALSGLSNPKTPLVVKVRSYSSFAQ